MIGAQPMPPSMPTGMMQAAAPQMVPNPAFAQWAQQAQAWIAEKQKRQQEFEQACQLISGDAAQRFKIDIEADSTVAADEDAEKKARVEFLTAITPFLEAVLPQMQANPALAPLGKELVLFAVRGFRVSRQLEDAFETALDKLSQMPPQPQGKQGNTKSPMEIQAESAEAQAKAQVQQQANAVKLMQTQAQMQIERERLAAEQQKDATEIALRGREMVGREALESARMQHLAARDTTGLI